MAPDDRFASIVIPVGSIGAALDRQVRAVLAQELPAHFELVLAFNTPRPAAIDEMVAGWPVVPERPVRVVDALERRGAAYARNCGARAATGDRLAFCDADDLVHPGWLAALLAGLDVHDAVTGHVIDVFPDARTASWHPPATPGGLPSFLGRPYLLTGNLAVHRAAFLAVRGFDETLTRCEDIAFGWALTRAGFSLGYAPDAVIDYNRRAGLRAMLHTHYLYGRGMSETLARYGAPVADGAPESKLGMLRPNNQQVSKATFGGTARRGAIALGRLRGLVGSRPSPTHREPASR